MKNLRIEIKELYEGAHYVRVNGKDTYYIYRAPNNGALCFDVFSMKTGWLPPIPFMFNSFLSAVDYIMAKEDKG